MRVPLRCFGRCFSPGLDDGLETVSQIEDVANTRAEGRFASGSRVTRYNQDFLVVGRLTDCHERPGSGKSFRAAFHREIRDPGSSVWMF